MYKNQSQNLLKDFNFSALFRAFRSESLSGRSWLILLSLLGLSVFVSKSGISLFGSISVLIILLSKKRRDLSGEAWIWSLALLFPVAMLCGLFSLAGPDAVLKVFSSWPWPTYAVLAAYLWRKPVELLAFIAGTLLGLLLSLGNSFYLFAFQHSFIFAPDVRIGSFWDVTRWAGFLVPVILISFALLLKKSQKLSDVFQGSNWFHLFLFASSFVALILTNSRGPWLGVFAGLFILILVSNLRWRLLGLAFVMSALALVASPSIRTRIQSVVAVQKSEDGLTSKDPSNQARLGMWKFALRFYKEQMWFGTGFELAEQPIRKYMDSLDPSEKEKYFAAEFSFHDQHSSYLSMLVQTGMVFSILLWGLVAAILVKAILNLKRETDLLYASFFSIVVANLIVFIFYTAIQSFESLAFFPFLALLALRNSTEA